MKKTLRIPNEPRFVRALALAVEPADTLALLMEIGALSNRDMAPVRKIREALYPTYAEASKARADEAANVLGVLMHALTQPDHQAYLAYCIAQGGDKLEALATIHNAAYTTLSYRRPWDSKPDKHALTILHRLLIGGDNLLPPGQQKADELAEFILIEKGD